MEVTKGFRSGQKLCRGFIFKGGKAEYSLLDIC